MLSVIAGFLISPLVAAEKENSSFSSERLVDPEVCRIITGSPLIRGLRGRRDSFLLYSKYRAGSLRMGPTLTPVDYWVESKLYKLDKVDFVVCQIIFGAAVLPGARDPFDPYSKDSLRIIREDQLEH